jgi:hypothetical protein
MQREAVKVELEEIRKRNGGLLRAEDVVAYAASPDTALHDEFQWDDTEAARQYRLVQARQVIRLSVTVISEEAPPTRAYISLPSDRVNGGGYRSTQEVLSDDARSAEMVRDVLQRVHALRRKYEAVSQLAPLWRAAQEIEATQKGDAKAAA